MQNARSKEGCSATGKSDAYRRDDGDDDDDFVENGGYDGGNGGHYAAQPAATYWLNEDTWRGNGATLVFRCIRFIWTVLRSFGASKPGAIMASSGQGPDIRHWSGGAFGR